MSHHDQRCGDDMVGITSAHSVHLHAVCCSFLISSFFRGPSSLTPIPSLFLFTIKKYVRKGSPSFAMPRHYGQITPHELPRVEGDVEDRERKVSQRYWNLSTSDLHGCSAPNRAERRECDSGEEMHEKGTRPSHHKRPLDPRLGTGLSTPLSSSTHDHIEHERSSGQYRDSHSRVHRQSFADSASQTKEKVESGHRSNKRHATPRPQDMHHRFPRDEIDPYTRRSITQSSDDHGGYHRHMQDQGDGTQGHTHKRTFHRHTHQPEHPSSSHLVSHRARSPPAAPTPSDTRPTSPPYASSDLVLRPSPFAVVQPSASSLAVTSNGDVSSNTYLQPQVFFIPRPPAPPFSHFVPSPAFCSQPSLSALHSSFPYRGQSSAVDPHSPSIVLAPAMHVPSTARPLLAPSSMNEDHGEQVERARAC